MMSNFFNTMLFGIYPYVCLTVFFVGSFIRYDREPYTWKSDSSQMLRQKELRTGSNLFHIGVLFILFGHIFGLLTPHWMYAFLLSAGSKQLLAMVSGGIAGVLAIIGLTILMHRRMVDKRVWANTRPSDMLVVVLLWVQLVLGLATIFESAAHLDGSMMLTLAEWAQRIVTFRPDAADLMASAPWVFRIHIFIGLTVFLIFPFTRLVHIWSGMATLVYVLRPYQLVRARKRQV